MMFGEQELKTLDELNIGTGTKLRLVQTEKGSKRVESWSQASKSWNVMYRYNVEEAWEGWKKTSESIKSRKKSKKTHK